MSVLEKAFELLEKYPLCDNCLGRQFAALARGVENDQRGRALKLSLTMQANAIHLEGDKNGTKQLKILATNAFSNEAIRALRESGKHVPKLGQTCFLCDDKFRSLDDLTQKVLKQAAYYEYA